VRTESEAALNTKGPSTSRARSPFEVLSRGLIGCLLEAIKSLIQEGYLVDAGTTSPKRITGEIMISHYQVDLRTLFQHTFT
jgi:hypothetical protein